jgi:hypothetical protein
VTTTVKTILIGGGLAIGGFVVYKALSKPKAATTAPRAGAGSSPSFIAQAVAAGATILQNLGKSGQSSVAPVGANPFPVVTSRDTQAQQDYANSHGVSEIEGNQLIDLNTGNAEVYGPSTDPVPFVN